MIQFFSLSITSLSMARLADKVTAYIASFEPDESDQTVAPTVEPTPRALTTKQSRMMEAAKNHLQTIRGWGQCTGTNPPIGFVALDVEAYEADTTKVLEVGIACASGVDVFDVGEEVVTHLVVADHLDLHNGRFVPDHRAHLNFGRAETVPLDGLAEKIRETLHTIRQQVSALYVVGHSIQHDIDWLKTLGIDVQMEGCDIAKAWQAREGAVHLTSLAHMLDGLKIEYSNLHNAANDAVYTLRVFKRMMAQEEAARLDEVSLL